MAAAPAATAAGTARPESIDGTTTRPTTSPTTTALATVSAPNAVLPATAMAKTRGSSRIARPISRSPVPSTCAGTRSPIPLACAFARPGSPTSLARALARAGPPPLMRRLSSSFTLASLAPRSRRPSRGTSSRAPATVRPARDGAPYTLTPNPTAATGCDIRRAGSIPGMGDIDGTRTRVAELERQALADLLLKVGADAPTLCEGWTSRDLAAHLVVRATRPDAAAGILIKRLAGHTRRVQARVAAGDWERLVEAVRRRPWWAALGDEAVNRVEYFIHHEDVRRAQADWQPRELPHDIEAALWSRIPAMARLVLRRTPAAVTVSAPGHG